MESLRKIAQVASSGDGSREQAAQLVVDCNPEEVERKLPSRLFINVSLTYRVLIRQLFILKAC